MKNEKEERNLEQSTKKMENQSESRALNDFEKYALVIEKSPDLPEQLTMDSTSILEISQMANQKYSNAIVKRVIKSFNFEKLHKLKDEKFPMYLEEGKRQILELSSCIESLDAHTSKFTVSFLIAIGKILVDVEEAFGKKKLYMKWQKENFGYKHLRYFQHAKQLYKMGDFARVYSALGKNRLIEFDRLRKDLKQDYHLILAAHPFEDTTADFDGVLFKEHVDSIITYHRLKNAGVEFIEFDQAALIAGFLRGPITVQGSKKVKEFLDTFDNVDEQKHQFENYVINKGAFPENGPVPSRKSISLTQYIADLVVYSEETNIDDSQWIENHKEKIASNEIVKVYQFISRLVEILEINLNQDQTPDETAGERNAE